MGRVSLDPLDNYPGVPWLRHVADLLLVSLKIFYLLKCCIYVECRPLQSPEEGVRSPGTKTAGSCERLNVDAGDRT